MTAFRFFDGHNDLLYRLWSRHHGRVAHWRDGKGAFHLDLPRMEQAGYCGAFFAIWVPDQFDALVDVDALMQGAQFDLPLPNPVDQSFAQTVALNQASALIEIERLAPERFKICRSRNDLTGALAEGKVAAIMHMEGAEAIGPNLDQLHVWHQLGLRSLGPVWSRPTVFGDGVPFAFPSTPDRGAGLTALGKDLIAECDALGIIVDLSHLNEKGFDDVAAITKRPLVATHSNAHAVTPAARNLTDRQLSVIAETDGVVGLNFATAFLRSDGQKNADTPWDDMIRHLDHLLGILGQDNVVLGTDFDGAVVPDVVGDVTGLPAFANDLLDRGYGAELVDQVTSRNWIRFLEKALPNA